MHVVHIIADHGEQLARHFPIVARQGADRIFLFGDHRNSIIERAHALARVVPLREITSVERVMIGPLNVNCAGGIHDWEPVEMGCEMVAGRCDACGLTEYLPVSVPTYARMADCFSP